MKNQMGKWLLVWALLLGGLTILAQAPGGQRGPREGREGREGRGGRGGPGGGMMMMRGGGLMQYDADGNLQVDQKELDDGLKKFQERLKKLKPFLVEEFDANKDGKFDQEENREVMGFLQSLMRGRRDDKDGDWELNDAELAAALESMSNQRERFNQMMLRMADTDKNGTLSDEEIAAAKERMAQRRGGRGGRGDAGGGQGGRRGGQGGRRGGRNQDR